MLRVLPQRRGRHSRRARRSSRSRAPCSRRACRFRRIAKPPTRMVSRGRARGRARRRSPRSCAERRPSDSSPRSSSAFSVRDGVRKVSARDIPFATAAGWDGATTVAASIALASLAGHRGLRHRRNRRRASRRAVRRIGGSRGARADADDRRVRRREVDSRSPGDVGAARVARRSGDRLSDARISRIFFRRNRHRARRGRRDDASEIVAAYRAHRALGRTQAMLVVQPPPAAFALDRAKRSKRLSARRSWSPSKRAFRGPK